MNIVTLLSEFSLVIYLILGIYVLLINAKNKTNIIFFLMLMSLALSSLAQLFGSIAGSKEIFFYCIKATVFFIILYFALYLHFFLELTLIHKNKFIFQLALYIPVVFLIIKYPFSKDLLYIDVIRKNDIWIYIFLNSFWTYLLYGYFTFYTLISFILLYFWGHNSQLKRIKLQSKFIFISLVLVALFCLLDTFILSKITSYRSAGIKHVMFLIWILGIFYSIVKYRFLSITPEIIANYAISNISDSLILLNNDLEIIFINNKTEELIDDFKNNIINKNLSEIIIYYDRLKNEIDKMLNNNYNNFSCRIFIKTEKEPLYMEMKIFKALDKFNDLIGILIIGSEVKELKQLKLFYKLSNREVEIGQYIIEGKSNKEIGLVTGLSENTIKSHIMHIFNKLSVNNRIELINLLLEYNLIPRNSTTKEKLLTG